MYTDTLTTRLTPRLAALLLLGGCTSLAVRADPEDAARDAARVGAPSVAPGDKCENEMEKKVRPDLSMNQWQRVQRSGEPKGGWALLSYDLDGSGKAINIALVGRSRDPEYALALAESLQATTFKAGAVRQGCKTLITVVNN